MRAPVCCTRTWLSRSCRCAEWLAAGRDTLLAEVLRLSGGRAPDKKAAAEAKGAHAAQLLEAWQFTRAACR